MTLLKLVDFETGAAPTSQDALAEEIAQARQAAAEAEHRRAVEQANAEIIRELNNIRRAVETGENAYITAFSAGLAAAFETVAPAIMNDALSQELSARLKAFLGGNLERPHRLTAGQNAAPVLGACLAEEKIEDICVTEDPALADNCVEFHFPEGGVTFDPDRASVEIIDLVRALLTEKTDKTP